LQGFVGMPAVGGMSSSDQGRMQILS
jgi:hypothetical protein